MSARGQPARRGGTFRRFDVLGLCLAVGLVSQVFAGNEFLIDRFDTRQGLPQNVVRTMVQTHDRYLWVGTLQGVARFDGLAFTTFDENNTPGLDSSRIVRLFEDSRSNFWVGTENAGVTLFDREGKPKQILGGKTWDERLMSICEDAAGRVWLYTADCQLYCYDQGKLMKLPVGQPTQESSLGVIYDSSGLLLVGAGTALFSLDLRSLTASSALPEPRLLARGKVDFLLPGRKGGPWVFANGQIQKGDWGKPPTLAWPYPWDQEHTPSTSACEDLEGHLIVATYGSGVFWFDDQGHYTHLMPSDGLSHASILSVCVDHEGILWVGTNGGGLDRVHRRVFDVLPVSRGAVVRSVSPDAAAGLWIGYNGDRVDHWDGLATHTYTNLLGHPPEREQSFEADVYVRTVLEDRAHRVWLGTAAQGLFRLEGQVFVPVGEFNDVAFPRLFALYEGKAGGLWAGTQAGPAYWNGQFWRTFSAFDGVAAKPVQAIVQEPAGDVWFGTDGAGLERLHEGRAETFTKTNGLPSNSISALLLDEDGTLWAATSGGLARLRHGTWTRFTKADGLPTASLSYLLDDGRGFLWIGSNAGLIRARKTDLDRPGSAARPLPFRAYDEEDGLPTAECTSSSQPAACRTTNGLLWFPTIKGLVTVNPAEIYLNTNIPPVAIESVRIVGRENVQETTNSLRAPMPEKIDVPPGSERIEIRYTSLNLGAANRARFLYRMEGHDLDWTPAEETRVAYYNKLPPGDYHFHVRACNEDGVWNDVGAMLPINVLPPFWRTWWFEILAALGLVSLLAGSIYYVSTQNLQRQLAVMRQQEALEKERARIARDLHDQLGANLTQVALLGEMAETDKDLPEEVESHARQISQTARDTTRSLDEIVWTVNPANDTLDGLLNYICKYAQEYLALADLRYRLDVPPQLPNTAISPELRHNAFLAAKEAVNNVVKHSKADSAWLRLTLEGNRFILEIEDNGAGLSPEAERKGRNGLRNMRKRMEDVGGSFEISPRPGGGTRVRLSAPFGGTGANH